MKKTLDFIPEHWNRENDLIIYGASRYGEIAYYLLKENGICPSFFCDRSKDISMFMDIPVISPENLKMYTSAGVIIASADSFHEICELIMEMKIINVYDMCIMLEETHIDIEKLRPRTRDIYQNRQNYLDVVLQERDPNYVNFTRVQFVVSERCSLRCRDCTHLMQYYNAPEDIDLEKYKASFDLLLSVSRSISEVRILGGEPLMNRNMYKVIDWWHDNSNIGIFTVYTNGTIIPSSDCLKSLKKEKVRLRISDYGINRDRINKLIDVFNENNINYYVCKYEDWQDAGDLHYRNHSIETMQTIFANCFERNCITFFRGQLHRCPRSAHAMNLKAMPDVNVDYVDLYNWEGDKQELVNSINNLQRREWIEACNYCDGPNNKKQHIKPAIQIEKPLGI